MKPKFTALFALLFTQSAFAVTADQFKCKISFESKDPAIQSFETQADLTGLRLAVATPGTPDLPGVPTVPGAPTVPGLPDEVPPGFTILSQSESSFSTGVKSPAIALSLILNYKHAVKRNINDVIVEAKQWSCLGLGYKRNGSHFFYLCPGGAESWEKVDVRDGIPLFSDSGQQASWQESDLGRATASCTYTSTYY